MVPPQLDVDKYLLVLNKAEELGLDHTILENWYKKVENEYVLKDYR